MVDTHSAKPTRVQAVYSRLREEILSGERQPGERLKFPDLGQRYESSVGVIREALAHLGGEGLVESETNQGYRVMPLSAERLADLTIARMEVEAATLSLSIENGDVEWEGRIVSAHHIMGRAQMMDPDGRMSDEWANAHRSFHETLLSGCPSRRLCDLARGLRAESDLYQRWSVSLAPPLRRDIEAEHQALLEAALDRDSDTAVQVLRLHIKATTDKLLEGLLEQSAEDEAGSS